MPSRDLFGAREAWKKNDPEASKAAHDRQQAERHISEHGQYIKSMVYGGLDGIITTFAVVAGVAGASLQPGIVLILGFANLVADGLSMAMGDYLSTKAENEYNQAERARETWEVHNYPDGEKKELVELYTEKGLPEPDAEQVVDILSRNEKVWIDVMMVEELGIVESDESPLNNAIATFISFGLFGFVPLLGYVLSYFLTDLKPHTFVLSCVLTAGTLFVLGAAKVLITGRNWFRSGLEMLLIGGIAAIAAYGIGVGLKGLADSAGM